jgi:hypothetical protein
VSAAAAASSEGSGWEGGGRGSGVQGDWGGQQEKLVKWPKTLEQADLRTLGGGGVGLVNAAAAAISVRGVVGGRW